LTRWRAKQILGSAGKTIRPNGNSVQRNAKIGGYRTSFADWQMLALRNTPARKEETEIAAAADFVVTCGLQNRSAKSDLAIILWQKNQTAAGGNGF
jgi:hypothetical protein